MEAVGGAKAATPTELTPPVVGQRAEVRGQAIGVTSGDTLGQEENPAFLQEMLPTPSAGVEGERGSC